MQISVNQIKDRLGLIPILLIIFGLCLLCGRLWAATSNEKRIFRHRFFELQRVLPDVADTPFKTDFTQPVCANNSAVVLMNINHDFMIVSRESRHPLIGAWQVCAINSKSEIVGSLLSHYPQNVDAPSSAKHFEQANVWLGGRPTLLPLPRGAINSCTCSVNSYGQVVGEATLAQGNVRPVLWEKNRAVFLNPPPNYTSGTAYAINDNNIILGECARLPRSSKNGVKVRPCVWIKNRCNLIDNLSYFGISDIYGFYIQIPKYYSIENHNKVWLLIKPGLYTARFEAFCYDIETRHLVKLCTVSRPDGISDNGAIVGSHIVAGTDYGHAMMTSKGKIIDITQSTCNKAGWHLLEAEAIAPNGDVYVAGVRNNIYRELELRPIKPSL